MSNNPLSFTYIGGPTAESTSRAIPTGTGARSRAFPSHLDCQRGRRSRPGVLERHDLPLHFDGWAHFSEGREQITQAFAAADLSDRLRWPELGRAIKIDL